MLLPFYTTTRAAELLECNTQTVQRLCHSGAIQAHKRLKKWYILAADLVRYVQEG